MNTRSLLMQRPSAPTTPPAPRDRHLVTLRRGIGDPFFCFHPVSGSAASYADLSAALNWHRGVLGIQAMGLDAAESPSRSINEMAQRYAGMVESAQPRGPLLLGGWSMGGLLAFEAGCLLRAAGREITGLVLIDSAGWGRASFCRAEMVASFVRDLWARFRRDATGVVQALAGISAATERRRLLCRLARESGVVRSELEAQQVRVLHDVCMAHYEAMAAHESQATCDGPVLCLQASASGSASNQRALARWRERCSGDVTHAEISADHHSIVRGGNAAHLAELIVNWDAALCQQHGACHLQTSPLKGG